MSQYSVGGMRPQLVIEVGDRTLSSLLITPVGQVLPCSEEIHGIATRYLSSEIFFDPRQSVDPDFIWEEAAEALAKATSRNFFQRARRLGLRRPWDPQPSSDWLRLPSPLAVLSAPAALTDTATRPVLAAVSIILLEALLDPIFAFVSQRGFAVKETEVFVVIPSYIGQRARLSLHRVFRRRGFSRLTLVNREIAAAMTLLDEDVPAVVVLDVASDGIHLHHVRLEGTGPLRQVRTLALRTVRGFGWSHWIQQMVAALRALHLSPAPLGSLSSDLDRALMGLILGNPAAPDLPPLSPSLRLSRELLQEILGTEQLLRWTTELRCNLEPALAGIDAVGLPMILLGTLSGLEPLEQILLSSAGGAQPLAIAQVPVLERASRGVTQALLWLRRDIERRVETPPSGSLRVDTLSGEALEMLPATRLPDPGEECYMRQSFRLADNGVAGVPFFLRLLWGSDSSPHGNAVFCALPVEVDSVASKERIFSLSIRLRRSNGGHRLSGDIEAGFDAKAPVRAFAAIDFPQFTSRTRG